MQNRKIAIAIIRTDCDEFGGIEHQISNIVSGIDDTKFDLYLITKNTDSRLAIDFSRNGIVLKLTGKNIISQAINLIRLCNKYDISILQSHMFKESYIARIAKLLKPSLTHIYRVHTYIDCSFIPKWKKDLYHFISKASDFLVECYLPINFANKKELENRSHINSNKIKLLHNGVRPLDVANHSNLVNYYNLAMIANFVHGKGHDIALKALSELVKVNPKYMLYFIGGENSASLEKKESSVTENVKLLVKKLKLEKNVVFLGFQEDIGEILKDMTIVILPSYSEGTPNCLLEAMSIHKLIVASAVGGVPEFIQNGVTGFLHKNKDYVELSNIILNISQMSLESIKQITDNGYDIWRKEYSIVNLVNSLTTLYLKYDKENK